MDVGLLREGMVHVYIKLKLLFPYYSGKMTNRMTNKCNDKKQFCHIIKDICNNIEYNRNYFLCKALSSLEWNFFIVK